MKIQIDIPDNLLPVLKSYAMANQAKVIYATAGNPLDAILILAIQKAIESPDKAVTFVHDQTYIVEVKQINE